MQNGANDYSTGYTFTYELQVKVQTGSDWSPVRTFANYEMAVDWLNNLSETNTDRQYRLVPRTS
jgi:hypothetical protein